MVFWSQRAISGAALFVVAVCAYHAKAQGGPPMITDDTETVPRGHFEINTAFTMERTADGRLFGTPLVDFNYGLNDHMQIKVEIPWLVLHANGQPAVNGLGNTNIGVRWRFRDEDDKHRVALSIYPAFEFNNPVNSVRKGLVDRGPEFLLPLQWQTKVGNYGINGDIGWRFKRGEDEMIYGVVVGREFKKFELLAEIHATGLRQHLTGSEIVFNFGSRIPVSKNANFMWSTGRSIRGGHDPRFIGYAGVQLNF